MSSTPKLGNYLHIEGNANRFLQLQQELQVTLETQHIDVCLVSETHFADQM